VLGLSIIMEESGQSIDVVTLPLRLGPHGLRFLDQFPSAFGLLSTRTAPQLMIAADGLSPIGHGALRILLRHLLELMVGNVIFKGMQQSHAPLKRLLHRSGTGGRERDR